MKLNKKFLIIFSFVFFFLVFNINLFGLNNVFLNTFPYKANVYINNVYMGNSPIIIVNLKNGFYSIRIEKEGYQTFNGKFELKEDKTYNFIFTLIPSTFSFLVNNNFSIEWKGKKIKSPFYVENMIPGVYKISIKKDSISIKPDNFYSDLKWIGFTTSLLFGGLYIYFEFVQVPNLYTQGVYDGLKYSFLSAFIISSGVSIYSFIKDNKVRKYGYDINSNPQINEDQKLFYNALNLLNKGEFDNSLSILKRLLENFNNSKFYPSALYYIGYIYEKKNNYKFALKYYEKLIYEYPVYEWYDIALFTAARIYYKNKIFKKSLYLLNNILFVDKLLVSDEIVSFYKFLNYYGLIESGQKSKENTDNLTYYYNIFKIKYSESSLKYEVFYLYASYLLSINKKTEALNLLKIVISTENHYKDKASKLYNENIN